jgi:hypothetical protein
VSRASQATILHDVAAERLRQERLCAAGEFPATLAHDSHLTPSDKLAVVAEEFGEVAEIIADGLAARRAPDADHLREELIQVAACCVAWVEYLDDGGEGGLPLYNADMFTDGLPLEAFAVQAGAS